VEHVRAREIPITIRGHPGAEFPRGLPNFALGINLRYPNANHIYDFVASLIHQLIHSQKIIIIENPRGSWLWELPQFTALLDFGFVDVDFQHCKWSASSAKCRAKWTHLRTNYPALQQLAALANNPTPTYRVASMIIHLLLREGRISHQNGSSNVQHPFH
jgi:hypothetical protein